MCKMTRVENVYFVTRMDICQANVNRLPTWTQGGTFCVGILNVLFVYKVATLPKIVNLIIPAENAMEDTMFQYVEAKIIQLAL